MLAYGYDKKRKLTGTTGGQADDSGISPDSAWPFSFSLIPGYGDRSGKP